jgi:hypothetical protein
MFTYKLRIFEMELERVFASRSATLCLKSQISTVGVALRGHPLQD